MKPAVRSAPVSAGGWGLRSYPNRVLRRTTPMVEPVLPEHWRILVTGVTSIHGWPVYRRLREQLPPGRLFGIRPPKMTMPDGDQVAAACVTDRRLLSRIRDTFRPTHVVYGAGLCDLDACEAMPDWARSINVGGPETVVELFGGASEIFFLSTDLVFAGHRPPPGGYAETHAPDPVSVVGKTFAEAERLVMNTPRWCLVRLGLPTGASLNGDKGAVDFIAGRFRRNLPLTLFYDEWRSCVDTDDIAQLVIRMLLGRASGLFHFGGDDGESLHGLGREIMRAGGYPPFLLHTKSYRDDHGGPPRIGDVRLNSGKAEAWLRERSAPPDDSQCRKNDPAMRRKSR